MGNFEELKTAIQEVIRTNGNNEITGAELQNALLSIIDILGANATFAGVATPNTAPGSVDQNVFYLATEAGTYVNFRNIEVKDGEAAILTNKTGNWVKFISGLATQSQITDLKNKKQNILVSGVNIKTINDIPLLGSGNINIETSGGGVATLLTEITYDDLVALSIAGNLIPGMKYRITDYKTVVNQEGVMSTGEVFEIIVIAISENALSEDALANYNGVHRIKYTLANDVSKFKWASIGEGLIFDYYGIVVGANKTEITVEQDGITYYQWDASELPVYTQSSSPSVNDTVYIDLSNLDETAIVKELTTGEKGKGVIYEMEDSLGNQCPYDFHSIRFKVYDYFGTPSFTKKDGADEIWCPTFRDSDTGGDFASGMPYLAYITDDYIFFYKMYNNKVLYYPYTLHPIVLNAVEKLNIVDPEVGPIYVNQYMYDNTIIDCDNLFITLSSNVKVSNCLNLSTNHIYDNFINNLEIDTIKSENDVYFLENLETSDNYTTHIAKNSQGEVKIWNPADLVAE